MIKRNIRYQIDNIVVVNELIIRGWAFAINKQKLKIKANGKVIEVNEVIREDVARSYPRYENALYSGFEIRLPIVDKLTLEFDDGKNKATELIENGKQPITFTSKLRVIKHIFVNAAVSIYRTLRQILHLEKDPQALLYKKIVYKKEILSAQKEVKFTYQPKISIVVPLYNTPKNFLVEMMQSVLNQTYTNWELCLCDGSDGDHRYVGEYCIGLAKDDKRIVYNLLEKNMGIVGNTNECLKIASGDYIALFDHDDVLHPAVLFEVVDAINKTEADFIYTDEVTFEGKLRNVFTPHFKPDFAIDNLRANNYICHFNVFSRELFEKTGYFRDDYEGSQDYDMMLRLSENASNIYHIPKILYFWRSHKNSVASDVSAKPYVLESARKAIKDHLKRVGLKGDVLDTTGPSMYRIKYEIIGNPLISILIPNMDHIDDLKKCISSIEEKSTYKNYEIIIIENNSKNKETFSYYNDIKCENIRVVNYEGHFNYSAINNLGFQYAKGEYILLLNNDVEVITPEWLEEMLMYVQRKDVGAAGAMLYYPDNTIQHAGIGIGILGIAGHYHKNFPKNHPGYMGRMLYAHDVSAITGACLMVKRSIYEEVHGLDETFEVAFNDVDFCLKLRQKKYLIVLTPYAQLYHYESKSRGLEDSPEKKERFRGEILRFSEKWKKELQHSDPFYNPNLTRDREDFGINYYN